MRNIILIGTLCFTLYKAWREKKKHESFSRHPVAFWLLIFFLCVGIFTIVGSLTGTTTKSVYCGKDSDGHEIMKYYDEEMSGGERVDDFFGGLVLSCGVIYGLVRLRMKSN